MSWIKDTIAGWFGIPTLDEVVTYVNRMLNANADYSVYSSKKKLEIVFSNPALLKVISLQCELFSLGKLYVYKDDKDLGSDPFLEMIKRPNVFQLEAQFKWEYMFWNMLGNAYCMSESAIVSNDNKMYFLSPDKMNFPTEMDSWRDKIVLSMAQEKSIKDMNIRYTYADGTHINIPWGKIIHVPDLTNGTGNWFAGNNRIDALYKVIVNSEVSLDSTNINLRYAGKFMVAGQADPLNISQIPMGEEEKKDIETIINGKKSVHAVKSMIDIKRFVENIGNLQLDKQYLHAYYVIGSMYGIPKDVLEAYESGTFENQEKARGAHISYCLQPKGDLFFEALSYHFGYTEQGKKIIIDWEHLPFMQAFAKERAETEKIKTESILNLMRAGVNIKEINKMLDLELTQLDYERLERSQLSQRQRQGESNTNT